MLKFGRAQIDVPAHNAKNVEIRGISKTTSITWRAAALSGKRELVFDLRDECVQALVIKRKSPTYHGVQNHAPVQEKELKLLDCLHGRREREREREKGGDCRKSCVRDLIAQTENKRVWE